jgi:hypothetical protein
MVDIFNLGNLHTITAINQTYGATTGANTGASWQVPTAISLARLVKVGVQVDF